MDLDLIKVIHYLEHLVENQGGIFSYGSLMFINHALALLNQVVRDEDLLSIDN